MKRRILILVGILLILPLSVYSVFQVTKFFGKALGKSANLTIDAGASYDIPGEVWRNLAQGGEEKGRMLQPVLAKVRELKPKYIRIDHVFDSYDVVGKDASGNLTFNWSNLDLTLGDIRETGAIPFISLSYMPPVISRSDIVDLPQDWRQWELSVQRLVEHVSGKAQLNLGDVYYEVWNEPDLFGGFKNSGDKNYLELYLYTAKGAASAQNVNQFKIGGPATTGFYINWLNKLLEYSKTKGLRLDFISWHRYSKNLDDYEKDYLKAKRRIEEVFGSSNLEMIITEIGPNSENDPVYDGSFAAIHTIAISAIFEGWAQKAFFFEIKDGPGKEKFWGRWGILTHEKFGEPEAKPRFSAIKFLNQMKGNKVNLAGQGSWVKAFAKEEDRTIRLLVVNYDPAGRHSEVVPIKFINLSIRNFLFKRTDFLGGAKELPVTITTNVWETSQEFKPNSAAIFEIIPR